MRRLEDVTTGDGPNGIEEARGTLAPLRVRQFRRVWSSSLLSNLGHMILGVAAAWEMTRLTDSPAMVAMVQTALMLPLMLVALPAGAFADMFDRRKVALCGLGIACIGGLTMLAVALMGLITPWALLGLLVLIGSGVALYGPAWQSSIGELVSAKQLPAAVALGSVSFNLARSFGPALGGALILAFGVKAAFGANALGYIPLIFAYLFWRRDVTPSRLPPESFQRAIVSGFRYARHAPGVRNSIARSFAFGFAGAVSTALAPLIARDQLGGDAAVFGFLLGASGVGAIAGSLSTSEIRERLGPENAVRLATLVCAGALVGIGFSHNLAITVALFAVQGACTMLIISMLNVGVQLSAPRWVTARALSLFSSSLTGGIAAGALAWGAVANVTGIGASAVIAGIVLAATVLLGFVLPLRREEALENQQVAIGNEPSVAMALTARSGPIVIEIDYRVDPENAREFYREMQAVSKARLRNGGFNWSLSRDIADIWLWTERYECPTWGDYLHMRDRFTQADRDAQQRVESYNAHTDPDRIRRRLERPYGSVRWRDETPDTGTDSYGVMGP